MPACWKYKLYINTNMPVAYVINYEALNYLIQHNTQAIYAAP